MAASAPAGRQTKKIKPRNNERIAVMNVNYTRVRADFGPETRFEVNPAPAAPYRAVNETEFDRLKLKLLHERLRGVWDLPLNIALRRAANEAETLAWVTSYPLLVFPALFEEKAAAAGLRAGRTAAMEDRTRTLLAA